MNAHIVPIDTLLAGVLSNRDLIPWSDPSGLVQLSNQLAEGSLRQLEICDHLPWNHLDAQEELFWPVWIETASHD